MSAFWRIAACYNKGHEVPILSDFTFLNAPSTPCLLMSLLGLRVGQSNLSSSLFTVRHSLYQCCISLCYYCIWIVTVLLSAKEGIWLRVSRLQVQLEVIFCYILPTMDSKWSRVGHRFEAVKSTQACTLCGLSRRCIQTETCAPMVALFQFSPVFLWINLVCRA